MIRRRGQGQEEEQSSSEEEDAFSSLSRNKFKKAKTADSPQKSAVDNPSQANNATIPQETLPVSVTSSMKRHHKPNDSRKAKMDALIHELEMEKQRMPRSRGASFVPDKRGSFVKPEEEHTTSNIFVGNLSPAITEEDLKGLFQQFGELFSIKIMWPRSQAELSRRRMTGFVCFMRREDAEEAMEACNETDPFNVGRLLMLRWGKEMKRDSHHRVDGSNYPAAHSSKSASKGRQSSDGGERSSVRSRSQDEYSRSPSYKESVHGADAIRIVFPENQVRHRLIDTVASCVATDGSHFEQQLIAAEAGNRRFAFLGSSSRDENERKEHFFYRWRVYSLCQGDTLSKWRTEPFVMFQPYGRFWVPPPNTISPDRSEDPLQSMIPRAEPQKYLTGRQLERARSGRGRGIRRDRHADGTQELNRHEMKEFDDLVRKKLSVSRKAICSAMAFCFEKSGSARQIASLLKDALTDESPGISIEVRMARLYLISDILFNSQQPGVKNAFMYRDALEKMAPDIFASLGRHGGPIIGRMSMNKLRTAISNVLGAWTEWSVFDPTFLDELEARFEGREISKKQEDEEKIEVAAVVDDVEDEPKEEIITNRPQGGWTQVPEQDDDEQDDDKGCDRKLDSAELQSTPNVFKSSGPIGEVTRTGAFKATIHPGAEAKPRALQQTPNTSACAAGEQIKIVGRSPVGKKVDPRPTSAPATAENQVAVDGDSVASDDVDGEPLDESDLDGEPLEDGDLDEVMLSEEEFIQSQLDASEIAWQPPALKSISMSREKPEASRGELTSGGVQEHPGQGDNLDDDIDGSPLD